MPYKTEYLEDDGIVLTVYTQPYTEEQWGPCMREGLEVGAAHGSVLYLGDCRALPSEASSPFDVYQLVEILDSFGVDPRSREALVINAEPGMLSTFDFYVVATSNRGIMVRLFLDMEEARAWLLEEKRTLGDSLDSHPPMAATLPNTTE